LSPKSRRQSDTSNLLRNVLRNHARIVGVATIPTRLRSKPREEPVTIHVLDGRLQVKSNGETRELGPGESLEMDLGVSHSIRAVVPGEMLLTVHRGRLTESHRTPRKKASDRDATPLFGDTSDSGPVLKRLTP